MTDYDAALAAAIGAAREAGELLRAEFHRPGGPRGSGGHADIDRPAEELIRSRLLAAKPWGYVGEETGSQPGGEGHLWVVDPNDGTAAFLKGWRGSAVSIAVLRDGVPVLGVVYAFAFPDGGDGDLIAWAEGCPLTRNGDLVVSRSAAAPRVVLVSQDADQKPAANADLVAPHRYVALPSIAYRLARVAAGDGLAAVSLAGAGAWDYAAGHALLRATGGTLINEKGEEVTYTTAGHSRTDYCFGGEPIAARELARRDWSVVLNKPVANLTVVITRPSRDRIVADSGRLSRAQGCLLGRLAGDALGGLVEFRSPAAIRSTYPDGVRDLTDGGTWDNLAGQPTDDSEMALALARMLVKTRDYDPGRALDAYAAWWPDAWDKGGTLRQALGPACSAKTTEDRLKLAAANASRSSQSNGSLMRISPLGVFGTGRPGWAADRAREDSRLTHPNPVCVDSCAVYVAAIAAAVGGQLSAAECHAAALAEAERSNAHPDVRNSLDAARLGPPADYATQQGWVLIALQNAFYQLLHAPSLEEGIVDTVMRGGDTDTTAAIAGALLGAVHGVRAVPRRWLTAIQSCRPLPGSPTRHPRPPEFWPVDALELAEALLFTGATAG